MQKDKKDNIEDNKIFLVFIMIIVLLLCFLYVIKVIGRIDTSGYSIEDLSNLNNPDEIYVASHINDYYDDKDEYKDENQNNNNNYNNNQGNINQGNNNKGNNDNKGNNNQDDNNQDRDNQEETNTVLPEDTDINEITEEGFWVKDKNQVWETRKALKIFENPTYNNREIIAPGSNNSYAFTLINNNEFSVKCDIEFTETNKYNINMKYRLKQKGNYIIGSSTNWVDCKDLKAEDILINANKNIPYVLEWKWFDSSNDTSIGMIDDATYSLLVQVYAEEVVE